MHPLTASATSPAAARPQRAPLHALDTTGALDLSHTLRLHHSSSAPDYLVLHSHFISSPTLIILHGYPYSHTHFHCHLTFPLPPPATALATARHTHLPRSPGAHWCAPCSARDPSPSNCAWLKPLLFAFSTPALKAHSSLPGPQHPYSYMFPHCLNLSLFTQPTAPRSRLEVKSALPFRSDPATSDTQ